MKKLLLVLCALIFLAFSCAQAQGNHTMYAGGAPLVSIAYDDSKYDLDTYSYLASSNGDHIWLGMFYGSSYTIDCAADKYGALSMSELETRLSAELARDNAQLLETFNAGACSFLLYELCGSSGHSYYAATTVGSYAVHFEIYSMRGIDISAMDALKAFLRGVSK